MADLSTLTFGDPEKLRTKKLIIRGLLGQDGTTTDIRCLSNSGTYKQMGEGVLVLSQEELAGLKMSEFNANNMKGKPDTLELSNAACQIGNTLHKVTTHLRLLARIYP